MELTQIQLDFVKTGFVGHSQFQVLSSHGAGFDTLLMHLQLQDKGRDVWGTSFAQAYDAGIRAPELRLPIIIAAPDSPISSPKKLQALVNLSSVPKVTDTAEVERWSRDEVEPVNGKKVRIVM